MAAMVNTSWLLVLLTVLSVARVTHLVTTDYILDPLRALAARRAPNSIVYLIQCPWCLSIWVAAAAAPVVYLWHDTWAVQIPLLGLTASYLTGLLEQGSGLVNAEKSRAEAQTDPTS